MKHTKQLFALAVCASLFTACQKNVQDKSSAYQSAPDEQSAANLLSDAAGHVFTLSNQTTGNEVLSYSRAGDGTLTYVAAYAAGGTGTGAGLGSQGAVVLTENKKLLLAVNAGSNDISAMKITGHGLKLLSTVSSGGMQPVSITQYKDLVYVLNSGGDGNISGFRITSGGILVAIPNSTKPLSAAASGGAQISFTNDGKVLVITEKATNTITTYTVKENGEPGMMHTLPSANATPFGFAVGRNNIIYVSEAAGGAPGASTLSSYFVKPNGTVKLIEGPVGAYQSAACWVALSKDEKYAYTTNTGSNNLSAFRITAFGKINIASGIAAASGMGPIDASVSSDGKYLYVVNAGSMDISTYSIGDEGVLTNLQTIPGLPAGASGMATD